MKPSEIIQVTGGTFEVALLSFTRLENEAKKFFIMELQREKRSWLAFGSEGGRLSGMVSNRKSDKPSKELGPLNFRKRWWLNSVLTKAMCMYPAVAPSKNRPLEDMWLEITPLGIMPQARLYRFTRNDAFILEMRNLHETHQAASSDNEEYYIWDSKFLSNGDSELHETI
ncbi:hypothetical protein CFP56_036894 [Quercus suber]|uniref:Uncharacterized protein n=1 Tax=Quercus suber TaxID=58331 RepID=A0AAW0LQA2_QUESU